MTVLTQLSVGAIAAVWLLQLAGASTRLGVAALSSLLVAGLALGASTLHLGRPAYAYRALRMWRRSWLSREVLLFSAFSGAATAYAGVLWFGLPGSALVGGLATVVGLAGVTASACIYRVPARPAWNTRHTVALFNLTAGILGPLFAAAMGAGDATWLALVSAGMAAAQLTLFAAHFFTCNTSDNLALRGTARLLSSVLARRVLLRGALLVTGAVVLPLVAAGLPGPHAGLANAISIPGLPGPLADPAYAIALVVAVGAEILGRYLFFVSVVPQHQAAPYIAMGSEAA
jgi:DMSO reductase anchor subunit